MARPINGRFNLNTIIISICTFVMLGAVGWVGHTTSTTHDSVIALEIKQTSIEASMVDIKARMLTRADLSIELLKLQIPLDKIPKTQ